MRYLLFLIGVLLFAQAPQSGGGIQSTSGSTPGGTAGGVLSGTYPNPGFATILTVSGTANFTGTFEIGGNAMTFPAAAATIPKTVASGTAAMNTSAVASGACETVVTVSATGTVTTDVISAGFNGDPTAVTGYGASATGALLTIYPYPTADNVNFKVCNSTPLSITPSALTLNWRVTR